MEQYEAFLRIPSISALSQHAGDIEEAARFLADAMSAIGLEARGLFDVPRVLMEAPSSAWSSTRRSCASPASRR